MDRDINMYGRVYAGVQTSRSVCKYVCMYVLLECECQKMYVCMYVCT